MIGWECALPCFVAVCVCCVEFACAHPQLFVNGVRVDTTTLTGSWTTWNARVLYYTYDITSLLKPGVNVIGVMLGAGWRDTSEFPVHWMSGPCDVNELMLRLIVSDSANNVLAATDATWTGACGVRCACVRV